MLSRRLLMVSGIGGTFHPRVAGPYGPDEPHAEIVLTQFHCHTTESDGSRTPAQIVAHYLSAGYGALAISDHDMVTAQPGGIDTAIQGNETSPSTQHIIAIDSDYTRGSETDAQIIIDGILATGGEAELAHPNWPTIGLTAGEMYALTGYLGIEIHNSGVVIGGGAAPVGEEGSDGFAVAEWDALLADRLDVWGFAVDDLHWITGGETWDNGRCQVWMASNTAANLMDAVRRGNFVADASNHGVTPGWPVRTETGVSLTCPGATSIEAWAEGELIDSAAGDTLEHEYGDERYVRLVAVGSLTEDFADALDHFWVTVDGTWTVAGGIVSLTSTVTPRRLMLRRQREGAFTASVQIRLDDGTDYGGLMFDVRLDAEYFYQVLFGDGELWLSRIDGGGGTVLDQTALTTSAGVWYTIKVEREGSTIRAKAWTGGTEPDWQVSVSDSAWTNGAFGLRGAGAPDFDNLYIDGFRTYYQPIPVG